MQYNNGNLRLSIRHSHFLQSPLKIASSTGAKMIHCWCSHRLMRDSSSIASQKKWMDRKIIFNSGIYIQGEIHLPWIFVPIKLGSMNIWWKLTPKCNVNLAKANVYSFHPYLPQMFQYLDKTLILWKNQPFLFHSESKTNECILS